MTQSPKGYRFAVASAGFRKETRNDVALLVSEAPAVTAAVFTLNAFPSAPVQVAKARLAVRPEAQAVLINTGQANACTGDEGIRRCKATLEMAAALTGLSPESVLPGSTGVIGPHLMMDRWEKVMPVLGQALAAAPGTYGLEDFARAIMTTDAFPKFGDAEVELSGGRVRFAIMAKGAGMICPNMATMLCVVLCDVKVAAAVWQPMLQRAIATTFNRVTVDGDTSTNDTVYALANGCSGVEATSAEDLARLEETLTTLLGRTAYMLVQDGEGSSKVAHINVTGAATAADAELVARTVGHSQLVKTAIYGCDANWGRIIAAVGRSGATFNPAEVRLSLCGVEVFRNGCPVDDVDVDSLLLEPFKAHDITVDISMGSGSGAYTLLASDLGHEYVDCNAAYRS